MHFPVRLFNFQITIILVYQKGTRISRINLEKIE